MAAVEMSSIENANDGPQSSSMEAFTAINQNCVLNLKFKSLEPLRQ